MVEEERLLGRIARLGGVVIDRQVSLPTFIVPLAAAGCRKRRHRMRYERHDP